MTNANGMSKATLMELACEIVGSYVSNNHVPPIALPELVTIVYAGVTALKTGAAVDVTEPEIEKPTPAQIRRSVTPDALISFIDGRPYKILKRHLTKHGLNRESYCERYGLPVDYPMIASAYSERRSDLAVSFGLGKLGRAVNGSRPASKKRKKAA